MNFQNYHKQVPIPFIIFADFEAILGNIDRCEKTGSESWTEKYQQLIDCGFGYKVVCCYIDFYTKPTQVYCGKGAVKEFLKRILDEVKYCQKMIGRFRKVIVMSEEDEANFEAAKKCYLCHEPFTEGNGKKIDGFSEMYFGAAHTKCRASKPDIKTVKIPVVMHNLRGYDSHFIIKEIGGLARKEMEKYMSFSVGPNLVFLDSFQFMASSLDRLAGNLEQFPYTSKEFSEEQLQIVTKKGVYPYHYMDSFKKFTQTSLSPKQDFYSRMADQHITDWQYKHAKRVWETFKCKIMEDYHNLYLKTDVLLLADVFMNFRKTCFRHFGLDAAHYYTSPALSWDAMLRKTGITLELLTDVDQYLFIEKGMRGGVSYIAHYHAKANNQYLEDYNPEEPSSYIIYLDANNLYGWGMSQSLPTGGFKWLSPSKITKLKLEKYTAESDKGLIWEVDLKYPKEPHDVHISCPLAPEKMCHK